MGKDMRILKNLISKLSKFRRMSRVKQYMVSALACVIVFSTTYALVLPAITVEKDVADADPAIVLEEAAAEEPAPEPEVAEPAPEPEPEPAPVQVAEPEPEPVQEAAEENIEVQEAEAEDANEDAAEVPEEDVSSGNDSETMAEIVETAAPAASAEAAEIPETVESQEQNAEVPSYTAAAGKLLFKGPDYEITVSYGIDANLPADASLVVTEIFNGGNRTQQAVYDAYYEKSLEAVKKKGADGITFARYFDINIFYQGQKLEPAADVDVKISYNNQYAPVMAENNDLQVVHFESDEQHKIAAEDILKVVPAEEVRANILTENRDEVRVRNAGDKVDEVTFKTNGFSVYGFVGTEVLTGGVITADGASYTVTVKYDENARIPSDAYLVVSEIQNASRQYQSYLSEAEDALLNGSDAEISFARFFDITIWSNGEVVQPQAPVEVFIDYADAQELAEGTQVNTVEFTEDMPNVLDASVSGTEEQLDGVSFETQTLTEYGIVGTGTITTEYISARGDAYEITVSYDADANIPEGSELKVEEVSRQAVNEAGERYSDIAKDLLDVDVDNSEAVILFDISIVKDGQKVQPATPVSVDIKLKNGEIDESAGVVHFGETGTEVLNASSSDDAATFETSSFSIFALKELIDNEDGTYDLLLSVTGTSSSVTTYTDINVIFIMDTSQSMTFRATSEYGAMVTWNPLTGTIWGNSDYLDQCTQTRRNDTQNANYFNLYRQTGNNRYVKIEEGDQTPLDQLYVRNGNTYTRVGTIGGSPIRVSGSNTADPTPTHPQSGTCSHVDTRLVKTKSALESVMSSLAAKNTEANPDAVEMLLITFNGSATTHDWSTEASTIPTNYAYYTRWDLALSAAQTAAQNKKNAEASKEGGPDDTYVIFITDGTPTEYTTTNRRTAENAATDLNNNYGGLHLVFAYGSDTSGNLQNLSHTGLYEAQSTESLVNALTSIIGQINNANAYEQVVYNDGVTSLTTPLIAKDIGNVTFKKYRTVIEEDGKYYYEDTYDTDKTEAPAANIETTTDADGKSIKYDKTTGVSYDADHTYENNSLSWDVSNERLEKGWVYTCRFTVWPSQEAYDLVADLNNGNRQWSDLTDDEKASIHDASGNGTGPFSLKTNTEGPDVTDGTHITYNEIKSTSGNKLPDKVTSSGSGSSTRYSYDGHAMTYNQSTGEWTYTSGNTTYTLTVVTNPETGGTTYTLTESSPGILPITNPEPVALEDGDMLVKKVWDDSINPRNQSNGVIFYLWEDGVKVDTKNGDDNIQLPIGTGSNAKWEDDIHIAPGLMTIENGEIDVKELGHNYTLTEEIPSSIAGEYNDYSYEFSAQTVRPMEVNGELEYLILVQEPYYTAPAGATVYTIPDLTDKGHTVTGGTYYVATGADDATLKGENHKTSELDITKEIDASLSDKTSDELDEETFTYTVTLTSPSGSKDNGVKLWIYTPDESGYALPEYNNEKYSGTSSAVTFTNNTVTVTVTINRTQIARFSNLPTGTTYTITETGANGKTLAEEGYVIAGVGQSDSASRPDAASGTSASGTISETDTRYYNNFKNKLTSVDAELKVKKEVSGYEWKDGDEYEFTISAEDGTPMPETTTVTVTSEDATDYTASFGEIKYTEPGTYTYTVTETNAGQVINGVEYGAAKTITVTVERNNSGNLNVTNISEGYVAATDTAPASGTVTITNTWVVTEADALKVWENADGTDTAPDGATVVFTLYADGEELTPSITVTLDGTADEVPTGTDPAGYESEAWKASFVNLPKYKVVNGESSEIEYTIKETTGYQFYDMDPETAVASGGTITNRQQTRWVQFKKTDMNGRTLPDAVFTFEGRTLTSGSDGILADGNENKFNLVVRDTYYVLSEDTPPAGYLILTDEVRVTVLTDGVSAKLGDTTTQYEVTGSGSEEDPYVITITNSDGTELPKTGSTGTLPYTLGGIVLIMVSALMYGLRMMRRERRLN